jgi:hypothetical protein
MLTAIVLTLLAVVFRVFSASFALWNLVPVGAVSLYAGSRLPRRWAWVVPVLSMAISDLLIDYGRPRPIFELTRWTVYATFAAITLLGPIANWPKIGRWLLPGLAVSGSLLFFITSNLATWGEGLLYPMNVQGLVACYVNAIPFFWPRTLVAELVGTAVLFGLGPIIERAASIVSRPKLAEIPVEPDRRPSSPGPAQLS